MPTVAEMKMGPKPQFPPSGCKACDGLRIAKNDGAIFCLRHDPSIPAAWRDKMGIPYESLQKE